jgi:hypothetical protein
MQESSPLQQHLLPVNLTQIYKIRQDWPDQISTSYTYGSSEASNPTMWHSIQRRTEGKRFQNTTEHLKSFRRLILLLSGTINVHDDTRQTEPNRVLPEA